MSFCKKPSFDSFQTCLCRDVRNLSVQPWPLASPPPSSSFLDFKNPIFFWSQIQRNLEMLESEEARLCSLCKSTIIVEWGLCFPRLLSW